MVRHPNPRFLEIDLEGQPLSAFAKSDVGSCWGVLLRNASKFGIEEFEAFSSRFGAPLMYGDSCRKTFDFVHDEDEFHYDGISADDVKKIPTWLMFFAESCPDASVYGGKFMLLDSVGALELLPSDLITLLREHRQEFYGYPFWGKPKPGPEELAFSIDMITASVCGTERLRIHLPFERSIIRKQQVSLVYSQPHDFSLLISDMTAGETLNVLTKMRKILMCEDLVWEIAFQPGDVLLANNQFLFHGRNPVSERLPRRMHRIQAI